MIGPKLEDWFLKLGGVFFLSADRRKLAGSDAPLAPLQIFIPWAWTLSQVQDPNVNFLGLNFCFRQIGSLDFGVSALGP